MRSVQNILIFGASVRAAAFSALRAGLQPWCADLFADTDLRRICPATRLSSNYPRGFLDLARRAPSGPWMYTGGLENWPSLVQKISALHPLWGNDGPGLKKIRNSWKVSQVLREAGLPCPEVRKTPPSRGRWLVKPRKGAGGRGISFWPGPLPREPHYFQELIEGEPCSAVYLGDGPGTKLLGVTRQLVGKNWLNAAPFHYCGSIGPVPLFQKTQEAFDRLGKILVSGFGLRGLFGVDCILREEMPWPVEVNPRYPASVEVLEYSLGIGAMAWHQSVFDRPTTESPPHPCLSPPKGGKGNQSPTFLVGKAVLFAWADLVFPKEGPWNTTLSSSLEMPDFADIPEAGQPIRAGRPILTFFARAKSVGECLSQLQETSGKLMKRFR